MAPVSVSLWGISTKPGFLRSQEHQDDARQPEKDTHRYAPTDSLGKAGRRDRRKRRMPAMLRHQRLVPLVVLLVVQNKAKAGIRVQAEQARRGSCADLKPTLRAILLTLAIAADTVVENAGPAATGSTAGPLLPTAGQPESPRRARCHARLRKLPGP